ncbi:MAG TPA: DUF6390 family protein [Candidatus Limnocylindrales bacterium]
MTEPAMTEPAMTEPAGQRPMATASDGWMCPLPPASGPVRFARYAFGPNRLGYCGPDEAPELFAQATSGRDDARLRALARQFEGAWPYLELIAATSGRPDALDAAVVQSYWLGGGLLGSVRPRDIGDSIEARFRPRLDPAGWRWLATKPEAGAVPVHAFHVLDVFPRVGLLRSGQTDRALEVMDSCRIRWGRVEARDGDWLVTRTVPLELVDGRLRLGAPRRERVRGWSDGHGFVDDVRPGDIISIHWDWACERLDAPSLAALQRSTRDELAIANLTI